MISWLLVCRNCSSLVWALVQSLSSWQSADCLLVGMYRGWNWPQCFLAGQWPGDRQLDQNYIGAQTVAQSLPEDNQLIVSWISSHQSAHHQLARTLPGLVWALVQSWTQFIINWLSVGGDCTRASWRPDKMITHFCSDDFWHISCFIASLIAHTCSQVTL